MGSLPQASKTMAYSLTALMALRWKKRSGRPCQHGPPSNHDQRIPDYILASFSFRTLALISSSCIIRTCSARISIRCSPVKMSILKHIYARFPPPYVKFPTSAHSCLSRSRGHTETFEDRRRIRRVAPHADTRCTGLLGGLIQRSGAQE
jgi:hypothetical protein